MRIHPLVETLQQLLPSASTPTLYMGPPKLSYALAEHHTLISVAPQPRQAKKLKRPAILACPSTLPFPHHTFQQILLVRQLRHAQDRGRSLMAMAGAFLEEGGLVVLIEAVGGFFAPHGVRPAEVSGLLLNAGFVEIEQRWPASRAVVTSARAGACVTEGPLDRSLTGG
ncbi:MAG: hypothetical protein JRH20_21080 [Deltaproteobacteria bacterium]|nr:hypothetical protein [Deltaproteobacteria bacterium]